jgi:hypothetical protein
MVQAHVAKTQATDGAREPRHIAFKQAVRWLLFVQERRQSVLQHPTILCQSIVAQPGKAITPARPAARPAGRFTAQQTLAHRVLEQSRGQKSRK